jgi:hypothetical protein
MGSQFADDGIGGAGVADGELSSGGVLSWA